MADLPVLKADADAISVKGSPNVRTFAEDTVAYLTDRAANDASQDSRLAALEAQVAALSIVPAPAPAPSPAPAPAPALPAIPVAVGASLFADDFTQPLAMAKYDIKYHDRWLIANVGVHDGLLDIVATLDAAGVWHGGELQSLAPAYQYIGPRYMEGRATVAKGAGTWSAPIWEWGAPWGANHVEIDVCEQLGFEPTKYHATIHADGTQSKGIVIDTGVVLADAPHYYGAAVYADRVDFYFDRVKVGTITKADAGFTVWPFTTTAMCIVSDLDMGGWGGAIDPKLVPPIHMTVDSLNVWALV